MNSICSSVLLCLLMTDLIGEFQETESHLRNGLDLFVCLLMADLIVEFQQTEGHMENELD